MVTKLGPLCKVKLLKNNGDKVVERTEKAGGGGSTPSLATMVSVIYLCSEAPYLFRFVPKNLKLALPGSPTRYVLASRRWPCSSSDLRLGGLYDHLYTACAE